MKIEFDKSQDGILWFRVGVSEEEVADLMEKAHVTGECSDITPDAPGCDEAFRACGYKGVRVHLDSDDPTREQLEEAVLNAVIAANDAPMDDDLEAEFQETFYGLAQTMRYRGYQAQDPSILQDFLTEESRRNVREQVVHRRKLDAIVRSVIEQEGLQVSKEELEARARELAEQEHTSIEQVRRFFGDEFELLEGDLLTRKTIDLMVDAAVFV